MLFNCLLSRSIDCFAPCVLFRLTMSTYQFTIGHCYFHAHVRQSRDSIDVLVVVYSRRWENHVTLSRHDQLTLNIWPRCWPRELTLTHLRHVNFEHPRSISQSNIEHYLIMTQWMTFIIMEICSNIHTLFVYSIARIRELAINIFFTTILHCCMDCSMYIIQQGNIVLHYTLFIHLCTLHSG